ncbi:hypothetical protein JNB11_08200 [Kocuria palustris]|nr:hypothetical protein [Kocuria palustris]
MSPARTLGAGSTVVDDDDHLATTTLTTVKRHYPDCALPGMSDDKKNFLRTPTLWDAEDDVLLMHLKDTQKLGWKEIASHFVNRTPNACQFRWRRLKLGNLKNPPKLAAALGSAIPKLETPPKPPKKKLATPTSKTPVAKDYGFNPIPNPPPFTGLDNSLTNALAGLNALLNSPLPAALANLPPLGVHTPVLGAGGTPLSPRRDSVLAPTTPKPPPTTTENYEATLSPLDVPLDPQAHASAALTAGGGYYADVLVDPTMNLPHNQPGPVQAGTYIHTPRNSAGSVQHPPPPNMHNNLVIAIARDEHDRQLVLLLRILVLSLPSKLMNIPHHPSVLGPLAHLPVLFGRDSVSGPLRLGSISGPPGIQPTIASLRQGLVVNPLGGGYFLRSGSVVIPFNADKKEEETLKAEAKKLEAARDRLRPNHRDRTNKPPLKALVPVFKLPWTMEEDELLINRRNRELLFAELLILLPQRTEGEIWLRIDHLEKIKNGDRALTSRERRRRQSLIGLDDVDDFYDDMMGGIDVLDDDDDDEDVLVEVDELIAMARRRAAALRKRRALLAVNPLAVSESFRKRPK